MGVIASLYKWKFTNCLQNKAFGESGHDDYDYDCDYVESAGFATVTLQARKTQQPPGGGDPRGNERTGQDVGYGENSRKPPSRPNGSN